MIGYGLDDIEYNENDGLIDSRLSKNGFLRTHYDEQEIKFTDDGFDEYVTNTIEEQTDEFSNLKILQHSRNSKKKANGHYSYEDSISNCIVYDPEFGLDNVLLCTPPGFNNGWKRYDDIIDYYEPSHHDEDSGITSGITLLNRSIWPFESYVDCRTTPPTRLNDAQWQLFIASRRPEKYGRLCLDALLKEMKFDSIEEAHKMIRAIIPEELVILLKYLNVFEKEEHIYELKPMLYWYWG